MGPVGKALWFVEYRYSREISLAEVATVCGVSRYHLSRAFGAATGRSLMAYLRGRRLTEAARALANGAPDILTVALASGYGSHEAFTRAFVELFGITPEALRAQGHLDNLQLVEPIEMDQSLLVKLEAPRFEKTKPMLIAGLGERFDCDASRAIPGLWERFNHHFGAIPGQVGEVAYGVCCNFEDDNFDYIAGVEVSRAGDLPKDFSKVRIPERLYAVFAHRDHISAIRRTFYSIWNRWLPESGYRAVEAPHFERYGPEFDPKTGSGLVEIWIPVDPSA